MITVAAVCPAPPLLARELTGRDPVLPELLDACAQAAARLLRAAPEVIIVVGPAPRTASWGPDSHLDLAVFAPVPHGARMAGGPAGTPGLPPSLGLGALLLDRAGYAGPRILQAVGDDEPARGCVALGARLASCQRPAALLVMGDGSARRSPAAPGYLDERAAGFDAEVERAIRAGDLQALRAVDPALARELMATGRPAWQVLSGAAGPAPVSAEVLYAGAPYGVAYLVAVIEPVRPGR